MAPAPRRRNHREPIGASRTETREHPEECSNLNLLSDSGAEKDALRNPNTSQTSHQTLNSSDLDATPEPSRNRPKCQPRRGLPPPGVCSPIAYAPPRSPNRQLDIPKSTRGRGAAGSAASRLDEPLHPVIAPRRIEAATTSAHAPLELIPHRLDSVRAKHTFSGSRGVDALNSRGRPPTHVATRRLMPEPMSSGIGRPTFLETKTSEAKTAEPTEHKDRREESD